MFRDRFQRGRDAVKEARRMGVPVVSVVEYELRSGRVDWIFPETTTRCAPSVCLRPRLRIQCRKATTPTSNRKCRAESRRGSALVDGVEYVDTSAYEQYEKQEGDFVEGVVETPAEPDETAEATVPPTTKKI